MKRRLATPAAAGPAGRAHQAGRSRSNGSVEAAPKRRKKKERVPGLEKDPLFVAADSDSDEGRGFGGDDAKARRSAARPRKGARPSSGDADDAADGEEDRGDEAPAGEEGGLDEDGEFDLETADEKRIRLARALVERVRAGEEGSDDEEFVGVVGDAEEDEERRLGEDPVARRLRMRMERERGHMSHPFASRARSQSLTVVPDSSVSVMRGHRLSATSLALADDDTTAYTGSKDGSVIQWDLATGRRVAVIGGAHDRGSDPKAHEGAVLAVAVTSDGGLLATGGDDGQVRLWDPRTRGVQHSMGGHRGAVTCLAFRRLTADLFSGGKDRNVNVWNGAQGSYVDTLYGHEAEITGIDSLFHNRTVTCSVDRTVRLWKVEEETQLTFESHRPACDCVAMLAEDRFLSGHQDSGLALWSTEKRRPIYQVNNAHGGRWVTAAAALPFSDAVATGSADGTVRIWEVEDGTRLVPLVSAPVAGCVNSLRFSRRGRFLLAAVGQEHRLGRWFRIPAGRNGLHLIPLLRGTPSAAERE